MSHPRRLAVAVSGGLDSTALLHCTARLVAGQGVQVHALHVHHGLHADADAWMTQVARQCRRWSRADAPIHFQAHRVVERPAPGDSIEAWARRQRYVALADMARNAGCELVLLAHHRRDQAETLLLQALRGAGPAGLAAMPRAAQRAGLTWARPWLDQPRSAIEAYARRWRLRYVVDPANADIRYARSRLRTQVWPVLLANFADAELTLSAAARRAHEARAIVDEVARADAVHARNASGALVIESCAALSLERQANLLRHWLSSSLQAPPPETLVQRLLLELPGARTGTWPAGDQWLRLHRGVLQVQPRQAPRQAEARLIDLSRPGLHALAPWAGALRVEAVASGGVPAALLTAAVLTPRRGGEQFQAHARGLPRSLKKQFQDQDVPAWSRDGPLVLAPAGLVFVPGLGTDARALQWPGSPRVTLHWVP